MVQLLDRTVREELRASWKYQETSKPTRILLLDRQLPAWDAIRIERRVIDATPKALYAATRDTDFLEAARASGVVRVLFALRTAAERVVTALQLRKYVRPPAPATLRVRDIPLRGEWVMLGQDWPNEIAFGAIGRFWAGETKWLRTDTGDFLAFRQSGYAKIGCHFTFRALGDGRTLVTYEARTRATDVKSRRAFLRYWRVVSPFVGVVMRAMLAAIERQALEGQVAPSKHVAL